MTILWTPTPEQIEAANMTAFLRFARDRYRGTIGDFSALYNWSIESPAEFWQGVWDFCGVVASEPASAVVRDFDKMPGATWFPEARLNFAENLLRFNDDARALVFWNEAGFQRSLTYAEMRTQVASAAAALRRLGVVPGDRVAGFLPNIPETVVAMLAAASLGAIWSSCSPDFGVSGLVDRFGQIEPKVLFTADGYLYNGRAFDSLERAQAAREQIPSVEHLIVVPYLHGDQSRPRLPGGVESSSSRLPGGVESSSSRPPGGVESSSSRPPGESQAGSASRPYLLWPNLLAGAPVAESHFEQLPFDHPLYILYSSGTTGQPKCIVHSAGGVLLQHLKEHVLHCDLRRDDRLLYFTTCGWMMWNWLVSALAVGCEVLLYDGSPLAREGRILFDLAEQELMTILGTSPKFLSAAEKEGLAPRETHNLAALRAILSTGSPLSGESFDYVYQKIKPDLRLSSISGGTDLCSCFALGNPIAPVYRGEIQTRGLGMKVAVYDDDGRSIVGHKGELVCEAPFPSMPLGFWRDADGRGYRRAYFERFPGVWHHGDYAELTPRGGLVIYGRSDAVLNPGGVRIGTAEIYRQVEQLPEVLESVVVGQDWQGDVRVVLFVKLRQGVPLDDALVARIKDQIRRNTTPRHVPAKILAVTDIPRTKSGKIVELAVREVIHGHEPKNLDALANPESLQQYRNRL